MKKKKYDFLSRALTVDWVRYLLSPHNILFQLLSIYCPEQTLLNYAWKEEWGLLRD